ncbi:MAG: glycosyltransferase family 2 protein [Dehalococcoidia bacterium]
MVAERLRNEGESAYILVTALKNEEANLPALIRSVANQTLRPAVWCIVDDGSTDRSADIISDAALEHPWIHMVKLHQDLAYDIGKHYASVCITGFDHALAYCEQNNLEFDYIALSDADMVYPEDYFAKCIDFLRENLEFGIVSGSILVQEKGGGTYKESRLELGDGRPRGTGRVWRKEAFIDTGGYIMAKSPDTVSNVKALLRGWRIKQLSEITCYQTRDTGGKSGLWRGYFHRGERSYYLSMTPLSILNAIVDMMLISRPKGRLTRSLALFLGYCKSFLRREEKLDDDEIKVYFGSYRRIAGNYWLFLRALTKKRKTDEL